MRRKSVAGKHLAGLAVTTFRGRPDPTKDNYEARIRKVHRQTPPETIFNQAEDARKIVRQGIWHVIDETTPRNSGVT